MLNNDVRQREKKIERNGESSMENKREMHFELCGSREPYEMFNH